MGYIGIQWELKVCVNILAGFSELSKWVSECLPNKKKMVWWLWYIHMKDTHTHPKSLCKHRLQMISQTRPASTKDVKRCNGDGLGQIRYHRVWMSKTKANKGFLLRGMDFKPNKKHHSLLMNLLRLVLVSFHSHFIQKNIHSQVTFWSQNIPRWERERKRERGGRELQQQWW